MVLSDPMNPNSLYKLDLTTGKVIEEWKVSENLSVNNFIPDSKYAQTTQQQTFIGTSHNGIFRIDPRLSGNKLVDSEYKQYASKNDFSAAATTESGRLAVTSNKGEIRLFDSIGKNAKTALPAIGQPIIGVDVSADGRYVVATCKTYLLFIDTKIGEGRYAGQSGCKSHRSRSGRKDVSADSLRSQSTAASLQTQSPYHAGSSSSRSTSSTSETSTSRLPSSTPDLTCWRRRSSLPRVHSSLPSTSGVSSPARTTTRSSGTTRPSWPTTSATATIGRLCVASLAIHLLGG